MQTRRSSPPLLTLAVVLSSAPLLQGAPANQLTADEKGAGWTLLFDGATTHGWHSFRKDTFPAKGWDVQDGWLHGLGRGGGDILSDGEFEQFELEWDWKQAPAGNSGLKYFVLDTRNTPLGHEYQMIDDAHEADASHAKRVTAAFYDVLAPTSKPHTKPAGDINHSRVLVQGNHVEHWLNGEKVLQYSCGSDEVKAAVATSKFKNVRGFGERAKGHILLQEHGSEVWFRNLKLRDMSSQLSK